MSGGFNQSLSDLFIDIRFVRSNGEQVAIDPSKYFQSLTMEEKSESAMSGSIVLFDEDFDVLESLLITSGSNREMRFRWGWLDESSKKPIPFYKVFVTGYKPQPSYEGLTLNIEYITTGSFRQAIDKKPKPQSWKANTPLHQIVQDLADYYGWRTQDNKGRKTIEPTNISLDQGININDETPFSFIKNRLKPRAVNQFGEGFRCALNGEGDDEETVIHFHSEDFVAKQEPNNSVAKKYVYARGINSEVESFEPEDNSFFQSLVGVKEGEFAGTESQQGEKLEETTERQGQNQRHEQHESTMTRLTEEELIRSRTYISARNINDYRSKVQQFISQQLEGVMQASMSVHGTNDVVPFDRINVEYTLPNGRPHYMSGVYSVFGITHEVGTDSWKTSFNLRRRGGLETVQGDDVVGQLEDRNTDESIASGLKLITKDVEP